MLRRAAACLAVLAASAALHAVGPAVLAPRGSPRVPRRRDRGPVPGLRRPPPARRLAPTPLRPRGPERVVRRAGRPRRPLPGDGQRGPRRARRRDEGLGPLRRGGARGARGRRRARRPRLRRDVARRSRLRDRRLRQGRPVLRPPGEVHLGPGLRPLGRALRRDRRRGPRPPRDPGREVGDRARLLGDAHPLAARGRGWSRVRRQRSRGHRLPDRRPGPGLRAPRLRLPRDQGPRRRPGREPLRRGDRRADGRGDRRAPRPRRPRPPPPARATWWPRSR